MAPGSFQGVAHVSRATEISAHQTRGDSGCHLQYIPHRGARECHDAFVARLPAIVAARFMIYAVHKNRPWIVIVEPDLDSTLLVVVTPYEVSE